VVGTGSQADDQGMFTELSVLYAKYRPEKRQLAIFTDSNLAYAQLWSTSSSSGSDVTL
jgi:hypothetical protein